jgi:hypothetical protein
MPKELVKTLKNSKRNKAIAGLVGGGILAGVGWYAWQRLKPVEFSPLVDVDKEIEDAVKDAKVTQVVLDDATSISEDNLEAVIAKDWEKAYSTSKKLGAKIFEARISNISTQISLAEARIANANNNHAAAAKQEREATAGNIIAISLPVFGWIYGGVNQVNLNNATRAAYNTLVKVTKEQNAVINGLKSDKIKIQEALAAWNESTGKMYLELFGGYKKARISGLSAKDAKDTITDILSSKLQEAQS